MDASLYRPTGRSNDYTLKFKGNEILILVSKGTMMEILKVIRLKENKVGGKEISMAVIMGGTRASHFLVCLFSVVLKAC